MTTLAPFEFKNDSIIYTENLLSQGAVKFECFGTFSNPNQTLSKQVDLVYGFENVSEIRVNEIKCNPSIFTSETPLAVSYISGNCVLVISDVNSPVRFTSEFSNRPILSLIDNPPTACPKGFYYGSKLLHRVFTVPSVSAETYEKIYGNY